MKTIEIIDQRISFNKDISKYYDLLLSCIKDKKVLIIGGAGTIGSNYIKEMLVFKPKKIVVVDFNENGLTELTRDLRSSELLNYNPIYITYPINLLDDIFDKVYKVANFSAHKHVRSEKDKFSVEALIKNNVYGCIKLLNLCLETPPRYFFSVSTDKAANPVRMMGASKRIMELFLMRESESMEISTARFANVAFSDGTVNVEMLPNWMMSPLFETTVQAVEEAIVNTLVAAETMEGINNNKVWALPHDRLIQIMKKYNRIN